MERHLNFFKVSAVTLGIKEKSSFETGYGHKCAEICLKNILKIENFMHFKATFEMKIERMLIGKDVFVRSSYICASFPFLSFS